MHLSVLKSFDDSLRSQSPAAEVSISVTAYGHLAYGRPSSCYNRSDAHLHTLKTTWSQVGHPVGATIWGSLAPIHRTLHQSLKRSSETAVSSTFLREVKPAGNFQGSPTQNAFIWSCPLPWWFMCFYKTNKDSLCGEQSPSFCGLASANKPYVEFTWDPFSLFFTQSCQASVSSIKLGSDTVALCLRAKKCSVLTFHISWALA